jgi:hypothetical protein
MATSLYDLSVSTFLQTVSAVGRFLDRTTRHCAETGASLEEVVKARLFPDMAPFHFQIEALTHHAVWGLEAVKIGVFAPPPPVGAMPFADLRAMVGQAVTALEALPTLPVSPSHLSTRIEQGALCRAHRDAERPTRTIRLGNICPADRRCFVATRLDAIQEVQEIGFQVCRIVVRRHTVDARSTILAG